MFKDNPYLITWAFVGAKGSEPKGSEPADAAEAVLELVVGPNAAANGSLLEELQLQ